MSKRLPVQGGYVEYEPEPTTGPSLIRYVEPGEDLYQIAKAADENTLLWLLPGEHHPSVPDVPLAPGVSVQGSGWTTVLHGTLHTDRPGLQRTMFVRDLVLEGGGLELRAHHLEVDRVLVRRYNGTAFNLTSAVAPRISRCTALDVGFGFYLLGTDGRITDCEVNRCYADAVVLDQAAGWHLRGVAVSGVGGSGFWLKGGLHTVLSDCQVDDYGLNEADDRAFGVRMHPLFSGEGKGCAINGGHIHNRAQITGTRRALHVGVDDAPDARINISGLTINANGEDGIRLVSNGGQLDALVTGTMVYGSGRPFSTSNTGVDVTLGTNVGF